MNEEFDIVNLLKDKKALIKYILDTITVSEKFVQNLPQLRERGWSEKGMLDKVIEISAIQSNQIKHLALIALLITQSSDFDTMVGQMMIKMGRGEEALKAMFDATWRTEWRILPPHPTGICTASRTAWQSSTSWLVRLTKQPTK
jgi:hypothetical protein